MGDKCGVLFVDKLMRLVRFLFLKSWNLVVLKCFLLIVLSYNYKEYFKVFIGFFKFLL